MATRTADAHSHKRRSRLEENSLGMVDITAIVTDLGRRRPDLAVICSADVHSQSRLNGQAIARRIMSRAVLCPTHLAKRALPTHAVVQPKSISEKADL